jgi:hypothetical protein
MSVLDHVSVASALTRLAKAVEEHNRLSRITLGVADPDEPAGSPLTGDDFILTPSDEASWEAEREDERQQRHR